MQHFESCLPSVYTLVQVSRKSQTVNKFVRTTLLRKKIMLFEINIYILVKKFERRTLRENNDSVKYYIYTIKQNWARSVTRDQTLCIIINIY